MRLMNLLQTSSEASWKQRDVALWYQSVRNTILVAMLISSALRLTGELISGVRDTGFLVVATAGFGYSVYVLFVRAHSEFGQKLQMMILFTCVHCYFLALSACLYPDWVGLWTVASCFVFFIYEIQSFHSRLVLFTLLARQFLMWHFTFGIINGKAFDSFPFVLVVPTFWIMYAASGEMKSRAKEYYRFCDLHAEQEAKLKSVLQAVPEGLLVATSENDFPCYNSRFQEMIRAATPQAISETLKKLPCVYEIDSETEPEVPVMQRILSVLSHSKENATLGVTHIKGKYYEWKGTQCQWGSATACIVSVSDISPWVSAQRTLRRENESKGALLRFVSHELRTPANAILNLVQKVMGGLNLSSEQHHELAIVVTSTHLLLSVVNDLLDFTRILADKFTLNKESFNVRKTIQEAISLVELQCKQKRLEATLNIDSMVPEYVHSDPNRFKQVLINLLSNAVRFTYQGGIRVVGLLTERNTLRVSVEDSGVGISREKVAMLLQALGSRHSFDSQHCGLGLYISSFLALHLGSTPIEIYSHPGVGSEFSFEVSIFEAESALETCILESSDSDIDGERETTQSIPCRTVSGGIISRSDSLGDVLIVDDLEFNRLVLRKLLEHFSTRTDEACSGLQAVTMVTAAARRGHRYRVVLMDVEMPVMDGVTATRKIREMESSGELTERVKIVACSAHRGHEDIERYLAAGMDSYLEKPVSKVLLQEMLARCCLAPPA